MLNYPKVFTDTKGRQWSFNITASTCLRLQSSALQINIEDLVFVPTEKSDIGKGTQPLVELITNLQRFLAVVYEIIRPDAEKINVSLMDFAEALDGNAMMAMTDAFVQGCYDFFRCPRKRLLLEEAEVKGKAVMQTMEKRMATEMPKTTDQLVRAVNQVIDNQLKKFASVWPASPESILSP
jgi:hypothetical protein